jgi:hypothetical protein
MEQNTIRPSEVAKAILQAVTSDNPDLWYAVEKDAIATLESRSMSRQRISRHDQKTD